jgi:hypothetical protein
MKIAAFALAGLAVASSAASAAVYSGGGFQIPDNNSAGASSVIAVAGDTPSITGVEVTLQGAAHTWVGDLTATLTGPSGTVFALFVRPGKTAPNTGFGDSSDLAGDYRFTDSASVTFWAAALSAGAIMPGGDFRTTGGLADGATSLNGAFAGQNSNGNWTLNVSDNASGDVGGIQGWTLSIVPSPSSLAIFGLAGIAAGRRRR